MVILPIRTETPIRRTPHVNYGIVTANLLVFLFLNLGFMDVQVARPVADRLALHSQSPELFQFVTYQFRHGDFMHLAGNLIFLWVFGNSVNSKMGDVAYLLFYLAGGVFAAWGYMVTRADAFMLVGASGSIAAVTTAYLVLFPRSRVTVLLWVFLFVHFFQLPAMVIIGVKIILWDNIIAPNIGGPSSVAHGAHLAGYLFGFGGAIAMLLLRALPRDQYDLLALWKRWHQRRVYSAMMANPANAAQARYGSVARVVPASDPVSDLEDKQLDEISKLRAKINEHLDLGETADALDVYGQLVSKDPNQCLSEQRQILIAREFFSAGLFPQAAAAFDRFLSSYPRSGDVGEIGLLVGIIYARDLRQYELANERLSAVLAKVSDSKRRAQCMKWLKAVRSSLGLPLPDSDVKKGVSH